MAPAAVSPVDDATAPGSLVRQPSGHRKFALYTTRKRASDPMNPAPADATQSQAHAELRSSGLGHDQDQDLRDEYHYDQHHQRHDDQFESYDQHHQEQYDHLETYQHQHHLHHQHHQYDLDLNHHIDHAHAHTPSDQSLQLTQLPPLPISPRWDSLSNSARFQLQNQNQIGYHNQAAASASSPASPLEPQNRSPLTIDAPSSAAGSRTVSPIFALATKSSLSDLRALESPTAESFNFSRPRKQSIRQPITDPASPRQANLPPTSDPYQELVTSPLPPWHRSRGPSVSSVKSSSSTFTSVLSPPTTDLYDHRATRARAITTASPSSRPLVNLSSNRIDGGASPSSSSVVAPWMGAGELRSSFRSQLTESTAPGTAVTERSSVLTKDSSVTSLYATADAEIDIDADEPSLEDVMGMYEKGFGDDDSDVDVFVDARPGTSASDPEQEQRRNTLEAMDSDAPLRSVPEATSTLDAEIRMSKMIFTSPAFTASVPHIAENYGRKSFDKRDSGKSLDSEPSISSELPPPMTEDEPPVAPPYTPPTMPVEPPEEPGSRDRYGFKKQNQYVTREQYDSWNVGYTEYLARRQKKWVAYLKDSALMTDHPNRFPAPNAKTKRFVRKGIPPEWRGAAWFYYAGGPAIMAKHSGLYDKLTAKTAPEVDAEAIERDLHRTFPDNVKFKPPSGTQTATNSERGSQSTLTDSTRSSSPGAPPGSEGEPPIITSLRRVLHAFSVYNPRIGYCQSLNFLAGMLLLFVETEEQTFWLLNVITRIYLPGTHEMNLEGSKVDLGVLMTELRDTLPGVWDKIGGELEAEPTARPVTSKSIRLPRAAMRRRDHTRLSTDRLPPITLCMTAWFMSCFIGTLPIETTLRVWDVFFYEGSKTLFRIALAIFKLGESEVKSVSDPMEMFGVVQTMPRRLIDANGLIEACFKRRNGFGHLSQETIDVRREERRNKAQLDRLRQGKALNTWNIGEDETEVRRKGTLFGKKRTQTGL
ncbi:hypothetical protein G7046_g1490 [Stylonectria norvegica]|nr:hypothetical protein G7046_g1490 [Stylonectria norvegica]